ncbi:sugar ABC transporter permease [Longispora fulva]|uniref:ABC-type glycerol-3-phosphate transport system permease component n=1 Tax=Longispora fulva TaxID=619741 RepID=A0A8J7KJS9_9ACTN|nr:carbohydrate ABC transporter permease [Longispora fulva]MBG6135816.1 ABC-type glycerol-3-phosphate transport system permease component [Longispora fulva]GIG55940.1 sugar ABC transporter permease [Longispora fulva]
MTDATATPRRRSSLWGDHAVPGVARVVLWIWVAGTVLLGGWALMNAFKPSGDIPLHPFTPPTGLSVDNFSRAWNTGFGSAVVNSVVLVLLGETLLLLIGAPAGYALSRRAKNGGGLTGYFALGMSIPLQTIVVPLLAVGVYSSRFLVDYVTGWWDDRLTLLIFYVVIGLPFTVFVSSAYFRTLPSALEEAAAIDGAGPVRTFFQVMLPLARPGLTTLFVIGVISLWNETFLVMVLVPTDLARQTLPVALLRLEMSMQYASDWGALFAGVAFLAVPMIALYAWTGRRIVEGMTMGALK